MDAACVPDQVGKSEWTKQSVAAATKVFPGTTPH